jgi:hypothetical protein
MECRVELIRVEIAPRQSMVEQISIRKRMGEGLFNVVYATPSGGLCPVCGRVTLYVERPGRFTGEEE